MSESKQTTELQASSWEKGIIIGSGPEQEEKKRQLEEQFLKRQEQEPERQQQALSRATRPYKGKLAIVIALGILAITQPNAICSRMSEAVCNGFQYTTIAVIALVVVGQISQAWCTYTYQSLLERTKQGNLQPYQPPRDPEAGFLGHVYSNGYPWWLTCCFWCGCVADLDEGLSVWRGLVPADAVPALMA